MSAIPALWVNNDTKCSSLYANGSLTILQLSSSFPWAIATMYDHNEPNNPSHQPALNSASPARPPQYKWWNCNYDCGLGCKKAKDDEGEGGGDDSDDQTVVNSENTTTHSLDLDPADLDDTPQNHVSGSQVVEPSVTADHSPVASAGGSARSCSPGLETSHTVRGMQVATPIPFEYFFLRTPLRLSAQSEHCRGDPASHLVAPDRSLLYYLMERSLHGYTPGYGYMSPPSAGI
jgi:hypothetical protein